MSYTNGLDDPTLYFNTKLYTGNGSTQSITGVGFQPDWVWIKDRSATNHNMVTDSVRGATKTLFTNLNNAESTDVNTVTAFNSDGFSIGSDTNNNANTNTYVSWNWLAGNTASSNTDGSITSSVSANTTAGFSIVGWTGSGANATIGHGLGVAPSMIITKPYSDAEDWGMYHVGMGNDRNISLNLTNAQYSSNSAFWNNTNPSSTVFTVGSHPTINWNTKSIIAYCFAEKKGYSKFGSYTGNGNADGTFVYTGFKPAFVMIKRTDSADNWVINDNKRLGYNVDNNELFANLSNAEDTNDVIDLLSNGFKLRHSAGRHNASGGSYIYMAFAESPLVTSTGIPTTAR